MSAAGSVPSRRVALTLVAASTAALALAWIASERGWGLSSPPDDTISVRSESAGDGSTRFRFRFGK